ncbi:MAG: extracellular solute-binding protein [Cyanobacteria bacterium SIG27]|nr:extracellular solute-binding protein [Cyanobacteria bacterium SIG27]
MIKRIVLFLIILSLIVGGFFVHKKFKPEQDNRKKFNFWTIQLKPIYEKQINSIIAEFEKNHPDYKVVWVDIPIQEAQKRTLASILSSTPPDLVNLNPDFSQILAQKNALHYFKNNEVSSYHPALINKLRYKGKIYALPFYATSSVTIYNKEVFNKCKISQIKTYDELFNSASKIKQCSGIYPFTINLNENDTLFKILNKYDISSFKSEKEKQELISIYSKFNEMYKNDLMPEDTLAINHREVIEKYMSNQVALIVAGSNFIKMIKQNALDIYNKSEISPQLVGKNGKYDISLMNLIIPKKSKNKMLALEFAFLLTNEKNQLELAKITNVLPANRYALNNEYFKTCPSDIEQKSRCISAQQIDRLISSEVEYSDKKLLNETLNKTLEEILLNKNSSLETIKARINNLFAQLNLLIIKN